MTKTARPYRKASHQAAAPTERYAGSLQGKRNVTVRVDYLC
jgi:hypothetical protein